MRHWLLKHRLARFTQFVMTGDDQRPGDCGYLETRFHSVIELDRPPEEDDDVVDGKLVYNPEKAARTKRRARLALMHREELLGSPELLAAVRGEVRAQVQAAMAGLPVAPPATIEADAPVAAPAAEPALVGVDAELDEGPV